VTGGINEPQHNGGHDDPRFGLNDLARPQYWRGRGQVCESGSSTQIRKCELHPWLISCTDRSVRGIGVPLSQFPRRKNKGAYMSKIDAAADKVKEATDKAAQAAKDAAKTAGEKVKNAGETIKQQGR